jgi:hypothetical protein
MAKPLRHLSSNLQHWLAAREFPPRVRVAGCNVNSYLTTYLEITITEVSMYRSNRQRINESKIPVLRAVYARTLNYAQIISAYHHYANTLECTGHKDEAVIIDQIICGYQLLKKSSESQLTPKS